MTAEPPPCAPADPRPRAPGFPVPMGACDCHAHIFGPRDRYPYAPGRDYTPPDASLAAYRHLLDSLGMQRGVIVQPSVYGTDNRCTLDAVATLGEDFRAVVVVPPTVSDEELERLHGLGARGVRVNLLFRGGELALADLRQLAERIQPLRWHLQLLVDVSRFPDLRELLGPLPVDLVFDHLGHPSATAISNPGFKAMLALLRERRAWVKLSGAYRVSGEERPPYPDVRPLVEAVLQAAPDRVLWGSDWPHPAITKPMPNDGDLLDLLGDWVSDESLRRRILVDNPARLYDFGGEDENGCFSA